MLDLIHLVCETSVLLCGLRAATGGGHGALMPVARVRRNLAGWEIGQQARQMGGHRAAHFLASSCYGPRGRVAAEAFGRRCHNRVEAGPGSQGETEALTGWISLRLKAKLLELQGLAVLADGSDDIVGYAIGDVRLDLQGDLCTGSQEGDEMLHGLLRHDPGAGGENRGVEIGRAMEAAYTVICRLSSGKGGGRAHMTSARAQARDRVEIRAVRKTGGKIRLPGGEIIDQREESVPIRYNTQSELTAEVKRGKNTFDFLLKSQ